MDKYKTIYQDMRISRLALGCMRIADLSSSRVAELINSAMEVGINFFDHADIYGGGKSEEVFAEAFGMTPIKREDVILQSKCGICDGYYDFSREHILASIDGILKRLKTDYLDVLLLHRPDTLMEPEEVAAAFDLLHSTGKVRYFGVSNQNPMQIELLKKYVSQDLLFNQLQLSIMRSGMIDAGLNVNMKVENSYVHDGAVLDYCRLNDITIQAWSPFQYGFFEGIFLNNEKFPDLNKRIDELAEKYNVTNSAIAVAWILRHPAGIQAILGSTNPGRISDMAKALDLNLTRPEWYAVYRAAGNKLP
ncbi:MAG: aldo/keto reductase [Spirochaetales bacterium]|nr:aldo/keto reductase [Spirochaetales bacterium]